MFSSLTNLAFLAPCGVGSCSLRTTDSRRRTLETVSGYPTVPASQNTSTPESIHGILSDWPGGGGAGDAGNKRKVPSILAKKPSPNGIRGWGFLCGGETPETEKWRYLKMFLEPRVL